MPAFFRVLQHTALAIAAMALSACAPAYHVGPLPGEPTDFQYAQLRQARIRYVEEGSGPTVVLLHGFASAIEAWDTVRPELSKRFHTVALDLKGFGWSERPPGDYSPQAQAEMAWELLDRLGVKDAALVAHSWGSSVALAMALQRPEQVRRVALYGAWVYEAQLPSFFLWAREPGMGEALFEAFYEQRVEDRVKRGFYDSKYVTEKLLANIHASLERPGTKAAALAATRGQAFAALEKRYPEVKAPVLLLWGEHDGVSHPAFAKRLDAELPQSTLRLYPRCGHFPMLEAAAASLFDLLVFLDEDLFTRGRGSE
jgi:pimeloyl-ACP methyl ester carboxylesterase